MLLNTYLRETTNWEEILVISIAQSMKMQNIKTLPINTQD